MTFTLTAPNESYTRLSPASIDLEPIIQANPNPSLIVNAKGHITYLNPAALKNPFFRNGEVKRIHDLFPALVGKELNANISLADSQTELFFCPCTEDQTVVYLKETQPQHPPKSKIARLLSSRPRTPKRIPSPNSGHSLGSNSQEALFKEAHRLVQRHGNTLSTSSYLPAYLNQEGAEEALDSFLSRPSSRSVSPFDSQSQIRNDLTIVTQLYFDTVHAIRNGLVPPFFHIEELTEVVEKIKNTSPTSSEGSLREAAIIKAQEALNNLKNSLKGIQKILDEQVEVEDAKLETCHVQSPPKKEINKKDLKILIAEDVNINFMVLKKMLENLGFTKSLIQRAENGQQAVDKMFEKKGNEVSINFDLIIMDIQMPEMDGNEATKRIREKFQIPIIACTGSTDEEIEKTYFTSILKKPATKEQLKKEIEAIFTFPQESAPA